MKYFDDLKDHMFEIDWIVHWTSSSGSTFG